MREEAEAAASKYVDRAAERRKEEMLDKLMNLKDKGEDDEEEGSDDDSDSDSSDDEEEAGKAAARETREARMKAAMEARSP